MTNHVSYGVAPDVGGRSALIFTHAQGSPCRVKLTRKDVARDFGLIFPTFPLDSKSSALAQFLEIKNMGFVVSVTTIIEASMNDSEYLDPEDQEKAVEIRVEDVIYRSDESPAVVLAIKRTCTLSGETKVGHVTLGQENTLRLYLEA